MLLAYSSTSFSISLDKAYAMCYTLVNYSSIRLRKGVVLTEIEG